MAPKTLENIGPELVFRITWHKLRDVNELKPAIAIEARQHFDHTR